MQPFYQNYLLEQLFIKGLLFYIYNAIPLINYVNNEDSESNVEKVKFIIDRLFKVILYYCWNTHNSLSYKYISQFFLFVLYRMARKAINNVDKKVGDTHVCDLSFILKQIYYNTYKITANIFEVAYKYKASFTYKIINKSIYWTSIAGKAIENLWGEITYPNSPFDEYFKIGWLINKLFEERHQVVSNEDYYKRAEEITFKYINSINGDEIIEKNGIKNIFKNSYNQLTKLRFHVALEKEGIKTYERSSIDIKRKIDIFTKVIQTNDEYLTKINLSEIIFHRRFLEKKCFSQFSISDSCLYSLPFLHKRDILIAYIVLLFKGAYAAEYRNVSDINSFNIFKKEKVQRFDENLCEFLEECIFYDDNYNNFFNLHIMEKYSVDILEFNFIYWKTTDGLKKIIDVFNNFFPNELNLKKQDINFDGDLASKIILIKLLELLELFLGCSFNFYYTKLTSEWNYNYYLQIHHFDPFEKKTYGLFIEIDSKTIMCFEFQENIFRKIISQHMLYESNSYLKRNSSSEKLKELQKKNSQKQSRKDEINELLKRLNEYFDKGNKK